MATNKITWVCTFVSRKITARNSVADRDPLQDTRVALRFKPELQPVVVDQAQQEEQNHPSRNAHEYRDASADPASGTS